ncbi:sterol desaturase family protein [Iamia sp.]|uniref:sterol desaturase family protein n=1 Tax=Iamia sp. TaxID=2722710 RepID=UPI002BD2BFE5|nr:sterol desaturase family protein [Iamia sp.]HXH57483.1 sterol desaturase family protein [Iamia sp.]
MDLTVAAVPFYFGSMGAEHIYLKRRAEAVGAPAPSDYERRDTLASLSMGLGSLLVPMALSKVLRPVTPGRGRLGPALVATAVGAAAATTLADVLIRRADGPLPDAGVVPAGVGPDPSAPGPSEPEVAAAPGRDRRRRAARLARRVVSSTAVTAVAAGITAGSTTWAARTAAKRLWTKRRGGRDLGTGALAVGGAILAWDFIYYWNHRFMHESRWLWAVHVVHHSSERYNLSTALRQPVADAFAMFLPYGALSLVGFRPDVIETARGVNLLYQFWVHTDAIGKLGPVEEILNTASHHRVHHGSNSQYLDRNHGSILILWDRLFGTFAREEEPVRYGLTKNVDSYNPLRIATHEQADILRDVAGADTWADRLGFVFRGPGWAYARHAERHEAQPTAGAA